MSKRNVMSQTDSMKISTLAGYKVLSVQTIFKNKYLWSYGISFGIPIWELPYKGTRTSKVSLSSADADIADLRDAVKGQTRQ
jgi:hypothetical protein